MTQVQLLPRDGYALAVNACWIVERFSTAAEIFRAHERGELQIENLNQPEIRPSLSQA
jgi:hypothetical protein